MRRFVWPHLELRHHIFAIIALAMSGWAFITLSGSVIEGLAWWVILWAGIGWRVYWKVTRGR
jgi:hypothetical protein